MLNSFYVNGDNVTYFYSFGVENIPKEIKKLIGNKNIARNIYRIQAYFIKEIKQNELIVKSAKIFCKILNYIEHLLIFASVITRCISNSAFSSSVCIHNGITSFVVGIKICAINAGITKYKLMIIKKKKHDKTNLNQN